jgi:hypothetical protein
MPVSTTIASLSSKNSDEDIQVTFYLTDAHEMNWVTEFLDAPFFARAETENLFGLINSNDEVRGKKIGRFHVDFHRWEPRHAKFWSSALLQGSNRGGAAKPVLSFGWTGRSEERRLRRMRFVSLAHTCGTPQQVNGS